MFGVNEARAAVGVGAELGIFLHRLGMHAQGTLVQPQQMKARQGPQPRQRDITLAELERAREVDHRRVERHALALMHGHRPGEPQWNLRDTCPLLASLVDLPGGGLWAKMMCLPLCVATTG